MNLFTKTMLFLFFYSTNIETNKITSNEIIEVVSFADLYLSSVYSGTNNQTNAVHYSWEYIRSNSKCPPSSDECPEAWGVVAPEGTPITVVQSAYIAGVHIKDATNATIIMSIQKVGVLSGDTLQSRILKKEQPSSTRENVNINLTFIDNSWRIYNPEMFYVSTNSLVRYFIESLAKQRQMKQKWQISTSPYSENYLATIARNIEKIESLITEMRSCDPSIPFGIFPGVQTRKP